MTHICVIKLTIIGSDNGLSPGRRQAIIWTNAGILLMGPLGTNFSEILIKIHTFLLKKMHFPRPQCVNSALLCINIRHDPIPLLMHDKFSTCTIHDDGIKWKHFPRYWAFVRGIHRSPVNSLHKGQRRGALMFSLICAWINGRENNREAGDLTCHHAHCDISVMYCFLHLKGNTT